MISAGNRVNKGWTRLYDWPSSTDELDQQNYQRDYQQNMDVPANGVEAHKPHQP
jgi:hypothetical protein